MPILVKICALFGNGCASVNIADADNKYIYLVTDLVLGTQLQRSIVGYLIGGQYAGNFCAEVEFDLNVVYCNNSTGNGVS